MFCNGCRCYVREREGLPLFFVCQKSLFGSPVALNKSVISMGDRERRLFKGCYCWCCEMSNWLCKGWLEPKGSFSQISNTPPPTPLLSLSVFLLLIFFFLSFTSSLKEHCATQIQRFNLIWEKMLSACRTHGNQTTRQFYSATQQ